ncbi:MAG: nucleotidyltransferase domain-containing protein [Actinobacteria bacterium]|nr:nucleotidyltransferase domain-containing protein [Actinomycetota bacterium]
MTLRICIFGSHAYGTPTKDSDLDVAIIVSRSDEPFYKRSRKAYSIIRDIDYPVEILVFTEDEVENAKKVKNSLLSTVLAKGIKLK